MKVKIISIDIIKFFAALLITNSHMEILYHPYEILATGGAIGDVLFFFASGYTLFLGRLGRFDNWYKRRINRIYPTVIAWAIFATIFFHKQDNIIHIILNGGGWFVSCIMIYYVLLYGIRRFLVNKLRLVFIITTLIIVIWYFVLNRPIGYNMYGDTYFKWGHYFLFMLLGAIMGISRKQFASSFKVDVLLLVVFVLLFYTYLFIGRRYLFIEKLQILSLLPLLGLTYCFYRSSSSNILERIYHTQYLGNLIRIISGLCLEIYIVQFSLFTNKMNSIFPLNILIMFVIVVLAAYLLRCVGRIFSQTFMEADYNWKNVFSIY